MKYIRTAVGHKVVSNRGLPLVKMVKGCSVIRVTEKRYVVLRIPSDEAPYFTDTDVNLKRDLNLSNGPWNQAMCTLLIKLPRGCRVITGGEAVGDKQDLVPGRKVDAMLSIAGAFARGYVWQATELTLGAVGEVVR